MHLVYCDESGNTGTNLDDTSQPVFVLGALVVPELQWMPLEQDLLAAREKHFPSPRDESFEIKANEIHQGAGCFRGVEVNRRLEFRNELFAIAYKHGLRFVYRAIEKKRFKKWLLSTFGSGITINPHVAAFPLVARVVDDLLQSTHTTPHGILIFDENRDVVTDVEKSHQLLRSGGGKLQLRRIIEKAFFIDSRSSLPLQLSDLCLYAARRKEEARLGYSVKPINLGCIPLVEPLIHRGDEKLIDAIAWLTEQKKGAARGKAAGPE